MVKISNLPAASDFILEDLLAKVDDPAGTAVTQKVTGQQILDFINANAAVSGTPLKRRSWIGL